MNRRACARFLRLGLILGQIVQPGVISAFSTPIHLSPPSHAAPFNEQALTPLLSAAPFKYAAHAFGRFFSLFKTDVPAPSPKTTSLIALLDDYLVVLFKLPFVGQITPAMFVEAFSNLLKSTGHTMVGLPDYRGPHKALLMHALKEYRIHPSAVRLNKPIMVRDIQIILENKQNPHPDLPWHALVYVDGQTIRIHEAFFRTLVTYFPNESDQVKYLVAALGHENVERPWEGQAGGSHESAREQFPLSIELEDLLMDSIPPTQFRYKDEIASPYPKRGVLPRGSISRALGNAYISLQSGLMDMDSAALQIVQAIRHANPDEVVGSIGTAADILSNTQRDEWRDLLHVLDSYAPKKNTPPGFVKEAQKALAKGEKKAYIKKIAGIELEWIDGVHIQPLDRFNMEKVLMSDPEVGHLLREALSSRNSHRPRKLYIQPSPIAGQHVDALIAVRAGDRFPADGFLWTLEYHMGTFNEAGIAKMIRSLAFKTYLMIKQPKIYGHYKETEEKFLYDSNSYRLVQILYGHFILEWIFAYARNAPYLSRPFVGDIIQDQIAFAYSESQAVTKQGLSLKFYPSERKYMFVLLNLLTERVLAEHVPEGSPELLHLQGVWKKAGISPDLLNYLRLALNEDIPLENILGGRALTPERIIRIRQVLQGILKSDGQVHFIGAQLMAGTPWNTALRWFWMLHGVTPLHESAHFLGAELAGQPVQTTARGLFFEGTVKGVRGWLMLLGAAANLVAIPLAMHGLGISWGFDSGLSLIFTYWASVHILAALLEALHPEGDVRRYLRQNRYAPLALAAMTFAALSFYFNFGASLIYWAAIPAVLMAVTPKAEGNNPLERIRLYLAHHPEINLSDIPQLLREMDVTQKEFELYFPKAFQAGSFPVMNQKERESSLRAWYAKQTSLESLRRIAKKFNLTLKRTAEIITERHRRPKKNGFILTSLLIGMTGAFGLGSYIWAHSPSARHMLSAA